VTGHTYLLNRSEDSILYANSIVFDTITHEATLINGRGESVEDVAQGKIYFNAQKLVAGQDGVTHGDRASFTTCDRPHAGYHIESRTIDIYPGSRLVARRNTLFLGPTAIFYLPLLVIPLREVQNFRRRPSFLPEIGYDQIEGFYIKARIGFGTTDTYYGYYRVEYFTKEGLGLGYVAFIGSKSGRRSLSVDSYTIDNRLADARQTNVNLQETENFSNKIRGQFNYNYTGDYGPNLTLPATQNLNGSIVAQSGISTENVTFSRYSQGSLSNNLNLAFIDSLALSPRLQEQLNVAYARFNSPLSSTDTLQLNSLTHLSSPFADYTLTYGKTDYSTNPFGYDTVPALQILPHELFRRFRFPPQIQLTLGQYNEPQNHFNTGRAQFQLNEPIFFQLGNSVVNFDEQVQQEYYSTGDEKAFEEQTASISTPFGDHIVNSITYNEEHPIGPGDVPFQLLDRLSGGGHGAQDVLRVFNSDYYALTLSDGTTFHRQAEPLNYQLALRPSPRSYLIIGGFYAPGPGQGFGTANVQAITPFGYDTTLEFATNVDFHNHERLEDKSIYLSRIIDHCYDVQVVYNQDLKTVSVNVIILAFPGHALGFGLGGQSSPIIPQSLNF
ncbi:MAG: hypothetical protein ACREM2_02170, partial [Vulcanimicrobiaceae bacterium]